MRGEMRGTRFSAATGITTSTLFSTSEVRMQGLLGERLPEFLELLGLTEPPMALCWSDDEPEGFAPEPGQPPTREREERGEVNWQEVFGNFSCVMGHIWRARRKQTAAYFSAERYGCPGGSFFLGFHKPQSRTIINYVSSGIPGWSEGERYCESPEALERIFEIIDPVPARAKYCVVKPVTMLQAGDDPEVVMFFARPETLCGLHQLACFVTNDPEVVASPWAAAYQAQGRSKAVIGGWDPSARKFLKTDELSFTVPWSMFRDMLERYGESFLTAHTWQTTRKKIARSRKAWGEEGK
jgi:uncharacterized protein (DUF169 family)